MNKVGSDNAQRWEKSLMVRQNKLLDLMLYLARLMLNTRQHDNKIRNKKDA